MAEAKRDANRVSTLLATSNVDGITPVVLWADPVTHRLLVDYVTGVGTVTSVSVVTANGISGTVATATTTPAITLTLGNITPSGVQVSGLTASELVATDASKNLVSLAVATYPSLTELSYVKGLSSALQTQLNGKAATLSGTINEIAYFSSSSAIASLAVATYPSLTELSYVKGVTSAIQTQLGTKAPSANPTFTGTVILPKTIEIQDTSADHQYVLAVSELTADRTITLPLLTGNDTFVFNDHTQTLTNKRITPRVSSETSSATPTINTDTADAHSITALAAAITSMTTNLSGTPTNFQKLIIRIKDDGTARGITWGTGFEAKGVALPTTTVISKVLTIGFIYDTVTSKWGCVASAQEA